jgi:hypothetical protein
VAPIEPVGPTLPVGPTVPVAPVIPGNPAGEILAAFIVIPEGKLEAKLLNTKLLPDIPVTIK